jgi:mannose-1-phosphate guanylyltransferase
VRHDELMPEARQPFYAVILAGGSGTRLWPLSRAAHPKFLQPLSGTAASLLQATATRVGPLTSPDLTYVVTGAMHATAVARQLPEVPDENILVEPAPRDSCAAIGLAAAVIARRDPQAVMGSFAADHIVLDQANFEQTLGEAIAGAAQGWLMTVGMAPSRPETGFGYIRCGEPVGLGSVRQVASFKEKPDLATATEFVRAGGYLWNAAMFVWRVDVFLDELRQRQPTLHDGLTRIAAAWDTRQQDEVFGEVWPTLPKIAVDYAVMEPAAAAGKVATVAGDFGWTDVGDFGNLGEVLPADANGNVVLGGDTDELKPGVLLRDAHNVIAVPMSHRLISVLGVSNVVVVDTPDVVLVCARDRVQDVKKLVDDLRARGDIDLV